MRTTIAYTLKNVNGKNIPEKIGLRPIQRQNVEYEFDVMASIDMTHRMTINKSRLPRLADKVFLRPDRTIGALLLRELQGGLAPDTNAGARAADMLYGDGAGDGLRNQPRLPTTVSDISTQHDDMILEISALVDDSGRDVSKYWTSTCKRFRVDFPRHIVVDNLILLKAECETYLVQHQKRTTKSQTLSPKAWLEAWRESTRAALPYVQDIFLAEQVKDALANDAIDRFLAEELTERMATDAHTPKTPSQEPEDPERALILSLETH